MPINILMPALSPTMTEGNLARWLKKEGDAVKPGDVIAEIETDKATMEVEAVEEGKIGKILVPDGAQGVKVNDVIAVLLEEGEERRRHQGPAPRQRRSSGRRRLHPRPKPRRQRPKRRNRRCSAGAGAHQRRPLHPARASSPARSPSAWRSSTGSTCRASSARARMAAW